MRKRDKRSMETFWKTLVAPAAMEYLGVESFRLLAIMRDAANERRSGTILLKSIRPRQLGRGGWLATRRPCLPPCFTQDETPTGVCDILDAPQRKGLNQGKGAKTKAKKVKQTGHQACRHAGKTLPEAAKNPIGWNCELFLVGEMNCHEAL